MKKRINVHHERDTKNPEGRRTRIAEILAEGILHYLSGGNGSTAPQLAPKPAPEGLDSRRQTSGNGNKRNN